MYLRIAVTVGLLCLSIVFAGTAQAMTVLPPSFDDLVSEAGQIVRARVVSVEPFRTTSRDGHAIIKTRVTWEVERTLKGAGAGTMTLEFLGGQVGLDRMEIPGMPRFSVGNEEFLFVEPNTRVICPLIAADHGRYLIRGDKATGRRFVARPDGRIVTDLQQIGRPLQAATAPATGVAAPPGLTPAEFEAAVLARLSKTPDPHNVR